MASKKLGWKILLFFIITYLLVTLISIILGSTVSITNGIVVEESSASSIINFVLYIFVALGLYGFINKRNIIKKLFWKVFLPVLVLWDLLQVYNDLYRADIDDILLISIFLTIISIPFLFAYFAIFKYAYRE